MTTEFPPRLFASDEAVRHIGEGLLHCRLQRAEWTHEAHLAATIYVLTERPEIVPEDEFPAIIRRFNESVGGVNDELQGYHETITQCFIRAARLYLARCTSGLPLLTKVNGLLQSEEGRRDWPLRFYSSDLLFSVQARLSFVEPDLALLP